MFARDLIESASLSGGRLDLSVRLNWYRSLPLSCLEQLEVHIDDQPLDAAQVTFQLGEMRCALADVLIVDDDDCPWWQVTDCVRLQAGLKPAPEAGPHEVRVTLGSRIPYLVGADAAAVVIVDAVATTAVAA